MTSLKKQKTASKSVLSWPIRLGIVGGGQLARMLALAGADLGLEVHILCPQQTEPAAQVVRHWMQGDPNSDKTIKEFCRKIDILTFESEFIDAKKIAMATSELDLQIFPSLKAMKLLQNRSSQKELLTAAGIPTAHHKDVKNAKDLNEAFHEFSNGFVLKKCKGGYDGYGTFVCKSKSDLKRLETLFPGEFIAEEHISFKRELALSLVRNTNGDIIELPLVETFQVQSRCDWIVGPIGHRKIKALIQKLKKLINSLDYVGVIAFEIFETKDSLLINEIAPRVHNSAHYSQNALSESQFTAHLKAGLGAELNPLELRDQSFCMINLIGSGKEEISVPHSTQGQMHWYGKSESRKGRKMGHLNYLGKTSKELLKLALKEREKFQI